MSEPTANNREMFSRYQSVLMSLHSLSRELEKYTFPVTKKHLWEQRAEAISSARNAMTAGLVEVKPPPKPRKNAKRQLPSAEDPQV